MKSKRALCGWEDSGGLGECPDVEKTGQNQLHFRLFVNCFSFWYFAFFDPAASARAFVSDTQCLPLWCSAQPCQNTSSYLPSLRSGISILDWACWLHLPGHQSLTRTWEFSLPAPFLTLATLISLNYGRIILNLVSWVSSRHQVWKQRLPSIPNTHATPC